MNPRISSLDSDPIAPALNYSGLSLLVPFFLVHGVERSIPLLDLAIFRNPGKVCHEDPREGRGRATIQTETLPPNSPFSFLMSGLMLDCLPFS